MGKAKGDSRGLAYLQKARPDALMHLLKFFKESGRHLDPKTRFLISVVTKVINFSPRGLQQYVRRALETGATADEILDAVLCSYPCAGLTRVVDAVDVILDMNLPGFAELATPGQEPGKPGEDSGEDSGETPSGELVGERWIPIAQLDEIPAGAALEVQIGGRQLAVFNEGGTYYASDNLCPHRAGPLVSGVVAGGVVTCPLHHWKFDLKSGNSIDHPGARVRIYPVRVSGEDKVEVLL